MNICAVRLDAILAAVVSSPPSLRPSFSDGSIVEKLDAGTAKLRKFKAISGAPEAFEF